MSGGDGHIVALRCAGIQRFTDTFLDGEFGESDRVEFEKHLAECESCRRKVKLQSDWKVAIKKAAPRERAPAALRNRVMRQIAREAGGRRAARTFLLRVLPIAAVAGVAATVGVSQMKLGTQLRVCDDVIAKHRRNLPLEVQGGSDQVRRWYADKGLDFPLRPPSLGAQVALRGGRLSDLGDRQAAYLVYDDAGSKVSVLIFDPGAVQLDDAHASRKLTIGNREVYVDEERGYNVALYRDHGVGYAITSDLDQDHLIKLVSSAVTP